MTLMRSLYFVILSGGIQLICSSETACFGQSQPGNTVGAPNNNRNGAATQSGGASSDANPYYTFFKNANSNQNGSPHFVQKWNPGSTGSFASHTGSQTNQSGFYGNFNNSPINTLPQMNAGSQPASRAPVQGGYDPRWNPNYGSGPGGMEVTAQAAKFTEMVRSEFPLPANSDETQMFQVNDFAARANGALQPRRGGL